MAELKKMVKASTLVETIVAMVIIMICAGIGLSLFTNISHDINDELRIEAEIQMNTIAVEAKLKKDFTDHTIESGDLKFERSFLEYGNEKRLRILKIDAFNLAGKKVCEYREIIKVN